MTANLTQIYVALSFGPEKSRTIKSLIIQQLPRPRTVRLLWDISKKLSGSVAEKVAPSHGCRIAVTGLELAYASPVRANAEVARRRLPQDALAINQDTVHFNAKNG